MDSRHWSIPMLRVCTGQFVMMLWKDETRLMLISSILNVEWNGDQVNVLIRSVMTHQCLSHELWWSSEIDFTCPSHVFLFLTFFIYKLSCLPLFILFQGLCEDWLYFISKSAPMLQISTNRNDKKNNLFNYK